MDFYIPKLNLAIEYNGKQHYQPETFRSQSKEEAKENFIKQQLRDPAVITYCKNNNINLLILNYKNYETKKKTKLTYDILNHMFRLKSRQQFLKHNNA